LTQLENYFRPIL